jgi:hypothetical protein
MLWHRFGPTTMMMRLDRAHGEVTFTLLESDWARGAQWVSKLEPLGNGERTLLTAYAHADVKLWWADVAVQWEAGTVYDSIQNIRRVVMLPKYGTPPAAAPAEVAARSKVVVPGFRAEGVPEETARTLTRVFAEQLMRGGNWNIVTQDEAVALLDYAQKAQLAGCAGETACAIDIGRALEASLIVHGSVGKVGETYVLSAALLKLPAGTVERRVSEQADGEGALLERVRAAAVELARP